ncbi:unnamed protein product [Spodoptera littoralis]|uniref:Inosine/uridine-preferring nucleoside hydrolase domain-containing protein n=1 Tax=Spodoptera littoralis TaxID=7109 RepID=A0A9P0N6E5_SPOLI|nr:unnamed protein product [Spodoptera littoralis]CAH1643204.1 unnamed protein product [Spodoptera littoralis]
MASKILCFMLFTVCWINSPEASPLCSKKKLVIDQDGGADDAFAITISLLNEKYFKGPKLVALTTSFGNVNLTQANINSDRILRVSERLDIPIYSGANKAFIEEMGSDRYFGLDGLGDTGYQAPEPIDIEKQPAAVALIELSKKYKDELIVVAIGPATNIALAVKLDPQFIHRLAHLYIGGGHIYSEKYPNAEFNAAMDPEAYHIVADSAVADKVTIVPFSQVIETLKIPIEWRKDVLGAIDTPIMRALNVYEQVALPKEKAWNLLDPAVAAIALHNEIVDEIKNSNNTIILEGEKRGIISNDFSSSDPNAKVFYKGNVEYYQKFILDVYSAELNP